MLLEYFLFVILNNAMAFVNMRIFSLTFYILISLLLLNVTLRGVSNKPCLLSFFSLILDFTFHISIYELESFG